MAVSSRAAIKALASLLLSRTSILRWRGTNFFLQHKMQFKVNTFICLKWKQPKWTLNTKKKNGFWMHIWPKEIWILYSSPPWMAWKWGLDCGGSNWFLIMSFKEIKWTDSVGFLNQIKKKNLCFLDAWVFIGLCPSPVKAHACYVHKI